MQRYSRKTPPDKARIVAYDFETTRIKVGTPTATYLTAYADDFTLEVALRDHNHLHDVIVNHFLTDDRIGTKYVAWAGNKYDAYFVAMALVTDNTYFMRPYLTQSNSLRGIRVCLTELMQDDGDYPKDGPSWEFLDGMAMLGLEGVPLKKFLENFAPELPKLSGVIDFEKEEFNPLNSEHCAYAFRDSQGLYVAMSRAQNILYEKFTQPLAVTMGGACIRIFQANIPESIRIAPLDERQTEIIRGYVMRGGYCFCVRRYQGPVWKYDINQAYASAMREAELPGGNASACTHGVNRYARVYVARLTASNPRNKIPFYYRSEDSNGRMRSLFATDYIAETWLTSIEVKQLQAEGWKVDITESIFWDDPFSMKAYVDGLEQGRMACEGGPSGPIGTMYKAVGNHSYGKLLEDLDHTDYILSSECPDGYSPLFVADEEEAIQHVYYRFTPDEKIRPKAYHKPHIGSFITAYVRMVVRRAALLCPDSWLYADTDCVVFSSDVTSRMDIDPSRYGKWKIEEAGTEYQIIAKKVYFNVAKEKGNAKGLNIKRLTTQDFQEWYDGKPPVQDQVQRQNFVHVMRGAEMFRNQRRSGTKV